MSNSPYLPAHQNSALYYTWVLVPDSPPLPFPAELGVLLHVGVGVRPRAAAAAAVLAASFHRRRRHPVRGTAAQPVLSGKEHEGNTTDVLLAMFVECKQSIVS